MHIRTEETPLHSLNITTVLFYAATFLILIVIAPASSAESIEALEERISELEASLQEQDQSLRNLQALTNNIKDRIRIDGFLSAGLATVDVEEEVQWGNDGPGNEIDWNSDSIIGLQLQFQLADDLTAVSQFVSRGGFNSELDTDWFYLRYRVNNNTEFLLGRVRAQFFMMSDYVEVGFAYPWIRPPEEVYDPIPTDVGQGITFNYSRYFGDWNFNSSLQYLQSEDQGTVTRFDGQIYGVVLEFGYHDWTLGLRRFSAEVDVLIQNPTLRLGSDSLEGIDRDLAILPAQNTEGHSNNISLKYDDGRWLLLSEAAFFDLEGLFVDTESFYTTLGYRFNQWLPHVTYAKHYSTDDALRRDPRISQHLAALPDGSEEQAAVGNVAVLAPLMWNQKSTAYTFGLNYFASPQIVLKLEAKVITDRKETVAQFSNANTSPELIPIIPQKDEIWVYGFVVDVVF